MPSISCSQTHFILFLYQLHYMCLYTVYNTFLTHFACDHTRLWPQYLIVKLIYKVKKKTISLEKN